MGIRFAVELFSVRNELQNDLWGTLRAVKKMGYDGVEFFGEFSHTAQELKAALDDTGLVCCGWHTPWHYFDSSNLLGVITYNKILGNTDLVVPGLPSEMTASKEAWLQSAREFNRLADLLAEYGMRIGYHNHDSEFKPLAGGLPFHYLFDNTTHNVGMQFDNGNALFAGPETDIYDPLRRYPNRARTLHVKPFSLVNGFATMVGEDDIDWRKMFELSFAHQQVEWYIVEYECETIYSPLEGINLCLQAFKKMEVAGEI